MILIITSTADSASMTSKRALLRHDGFLWRSDGQWSGHERYTSRLQGTTVTLLTVDDDLVYFETIDEVTQTFRPSLIIYATKHKSKANIPSLCVHTQGNWSSADYGGRPYELGVWPAHITRVVFDTLRTVAPDGIEVVYEATHHGPFSVIPSCFVEIGSDASQWVRDDLGDCIAQAIFACITQIDTVAHMQTAVGIGGLHTVPRLTSYACKHDIALGHIMPHYQLSHLTVAGVEQAIARTQPAPSLLLVDWKGLRGHRQAVTEVLEQITLPVVKVK